MGHRNNNDHVYQWQRGNLNLSAIGPADNDLIVFTNADGVENRYRVQSGGGTATVTTNRTVTSAGGTASGHYGGDWRNSYHAKLASNVRTVWETEMADTSRTIHVLGAQTTSSGAAVTEVIDAPDWLAEEPGTYVAPHTVFDECAVTSYYGFGFLDSGDRATLQALLGDHDVAGAWAQNYFLTDATYGIDSAEANLTACLGVMEGKIAARMYEGGTHIFNGMSTGDADDIAMTAFGEFFQYSSYGVAVFNAHFEMVADVFPGPYNKFNVVRQASNSGVWGIDRYIGEGSAYSTAIYAKDAANLPWWLPAYPPQLKSNASTTFAINTNEAGSIDLKALHRANVSTVTLDAVPGGMTLTDGVLTWTALTATEDVTLTPTMTAQTTDSESLATGLTFNVTYVAGPTYGDVISMSHGNNVDPSLVTSFGVIPAVNWQRVSGFGTITGTSLEDQSGAATTLNLAATSSGGNADTRATGSGRGI